MLTGIIGILIKIFLMIGVEVAQTIKPKATAVNVFLVIKNITSYYIL